MIMKKPKVNYWFLVEHYPGSVIQHIYIAESKQAVIDSLGPLQKKSIVQTLTWVQLQKFLDARIPLGFNSMTPAAGRILFRINKRNVTIGGLF